MSQNYCPRCGSHTLTSDDKNCYQCSQCDFELFRNVAAAVGGVLVCQSKILVVKRNKAPDVGKWDLPGGFVNSNESAEQALRRECLEETGIALSEPLQYLGAWPNQYPYKGLVYPTMDIFFSAQLQAFPACLLDNQEVSDFDWVAIADCTRLDMAFSSAKRALDCYLDSTQQII